MHYSMYREDRQGNFGHVCTALWEENDELRTEQDARPRVGVQLHVSNGTGRWWQTTHVLEILKDEPNEVVFRTKNSTYTWIKG